MSLGMLLGLGAFPRVILLRHLSQTSRVNWVCICVVWRPLLSNIKPLCVCQGYLRIAHMHVVGWSMVSSQRGACFLKDVVGCGIFRWLCLWVG